MRMILLSILSFGACTVSPRALLGDINSAQAGLTGVSGEWADVGKRLQPVIEELSVDQLIDPVDEPLRTKEVRGVWVTRWSFQGEEDVVEILDDVADAGFTDVYFQVRGQFDAFYQSDLEPWARELSGTLGKDPGWDPLEVAVRESHKRGLKLHAWVNTYAMTQGYRPKTSVGVKHVSEIHPEWRVANKAGKSRQGKHSYQFASPGNPEVKAHLVAVMNDIDERYEVDGIHLDYLRYPGKHFGYDEASVKAAGTAAADEAAFKKWRIDQIVSTVAAVDEVVEAPLSAAVWGIYEDEWGYGASQGLHSYYQDYRQMLEDGTLTAVAPMSYWPVRDGRLDFRKITEGNLQAKGAVYPGIDADKFTWQQVEDCILAARAQGSAGVMLFEYKALKSKGMLAKLKAGPFADHEELLASAK